MSKDDNQVKIPLLPLRDVVIFPHMVIPLFVGRDSSITAIEMAMESDKQVFLVGQKDSEVENPKRKDLFSIGTVATILQMLRLPDGTVKVLVEGVCRAKVKQFSATGGKTSAVVTCLQETESLHKILKDKKNFFIEAIPYRSHPQTNILLDLLKDKEFGNIKKIEANFGFRNKKIKKDSRLFNKSLGGGAILDLGCYPISFFNLFTNNKKDIKISRCNKNLCETGVDIDSEISLNINENIEAIGKVSLVKNLQNDCRIFCEKAIITIPSPWVPPTKTFLEIETKSRYFKNFILTEKNTYEHQLEKVSKFFLNSLKEENFLVDINESIQISKIIDNWLDNNN